MDITLKEEGWNYILTCIRRYQGEGHFLLLFGLAVGGLAGLLLLRKKNKDLSSDGEKNLAQLLLGYLMILLLTVFNIVIMRYVIGILDLEDEYYRFLWLLPTTIVTAYFFAKLASIPKKNIRKIGVGGILVILIIVSGKSILARGFSLAENLYKIPDEVMEISRILHDDSMEDTPRAVMDFDLLVSMNQYDPSIELEISYGDISTLRDVEEHMEEDTWDRWLTARVTVLQVLMDHRLEEWNHWDFEAAMDYLDAYYIVTARDPEMEAYLEESRCVVIGETEGYRIYRYYNSALEMPE